MSVICLIVGARSGGEAAIRLGSGELPNGASGGGKRGDAAPDGTVMADDQKRTRAEGGREPINEERSDKQGLELDRLRYHAMMVYMFELVAVILEQAADMADCQPLPASWLHRCPACVLRCAHKKIGRDVRHLSVRLMLIGVHL